jgi:hypothetical protein
MSERPKETVGDRCVITYRVHVITHPVCWYIPVLLCELHHHGGQLIQNKDPWQPLVANETVGHFLMSGH